MTSLNSLILNPSFNHFFLNFFLLLCSHSSLSLTFFHSILLTLFLVSSLFNSSSVSYSSFYPVFFSSLSYLLLQSTISSYSTSFYYLPIFLYCTPYSTLLNILFSTILSFPLVLCFLYSSILIFYSYFYFYFLLSTLPINHSASPSLYSVPLCSSLPVFPILQYLFLSVTIFLYFFLFFLLYYCFLISFRTRITYYKAHVKPMYLLNSFLS